MNPWPSLGIPIDTTRIAWFIAGPQPAAANDEVAA